jgi:hypothetical protein
LQEGANNPPAAPAAKIELSPSTEEEALTALKERRREESIAASKAYLAKQAEAIDFWRHDPRWVCG